MRKTIHTDGENPIIERITELLIQNGKTQKELMDYLGVAKAAYSDWKSGRSGSFRRHAEKIAEFLGSTPEYILYGDTGDPGENELLKLYRRMDETKKERLLKFAQSI